MLPLALVCLVAGAKNETHNTLSETHNTFTTPAMWARDPNDVKMVVGSPRSSRSIDMIVGAA